MLVVIAIIGILSSIVLVSLQSARKKGSDTRVIADVQQIRDALETGFNGSAYPDLSNVAGTNIAGGNANCQVNGWNNSASAPQQNAINVQANDACSQGGANDIVIVTNGSSATTVNSYAIFGKLVSNTSGFFCIDSTGKTNPATSTEAIPGC